MNKILIIYYTKTGFTEKYAQWVREETNCELLPLQPQRYGGFYGV